NPDNPQCLGPTFPPDPNMLWPDGYSSYPAPCPKSTVAEACFVTQVRCPRGLRGRVETAPDGAGNRSRRGISGRACGGPPGLPSAPADARCGGLRRMRLANFTTDSTVHGDTQ